MGIVKSHSIEVQVCVHRRYAPNPMSCANSGSEKLLEELHAALTPLSPFIKVVGSKCFLHCENGPNVKITYYDEQSKPISRLWHKVDVSTFNTLIGYCKSINNDR